jgi:hypothetical protein
LAMSDVENEMEVLQRRLAAKTREIEALVAKQQGLSVLNAMDSTDYDRLRIYVEELIYEWQEAKVQSPESNPDTPVKSTDRRTRGDRAANRRTESAMKKALI